MLTASNSAAIDLELNPFVIVHNCSHNQMVPAYAFAQATVNPRSFSYIVATSPALLTLQLLYETPHYGPRR